MTPLSPWLGSLARDLLDLVAPVLCLGCHAPHPAHPPLCDLCRDLLIATVDTSPDAVVLYEHAGPLVGAIHRAKYDGDPDVAAALGALLLPALARLPGRFDVVVPVPLHARRLTERGYNQSAELARALGIPIVHDAIERVRDTPTQRKLDREARAANVRGAFRVRDDRLVRGRAVLVVDDVVTTGSTLRAVRACLEEAGAARTAALTLTRMPLLSARP
jgi:ComF family protein